MEMWLRLDWIPEHSLTIIDIPGEPPTTASSEPPPPPIEQFYELPAALHNIIWGQEER